MIPSAPIVSAAHPTEAPWWQKGSIYQIYPLSFKDSNGDGSGDLRGIISRLDYCRWLGINAVWLSPIYPSPMIDFGYDISNFTDIHPLFGTLSDFDALISEARRLNLKILLDYVPNHSSDQHSWFLRVQVVPEQSLPRLVHLARSSARRRAAQQLVERIRRQRLGVG